MHVDIVKAIRFSHSLAASLLSSLVDGPNDEQCVYIPASENASSHCISRKKQLGQNRHILKASTKSVNATFSLYGEGSFGRGKMLEAVL